MEHFWNLMYIIVREISSAIIYYYFFLDYLLIPRKVFYVLYSVLLFIEWGMCYYQNGLPIWQQYAFASSFGVLAILVVKISLRKKMFVILMLANLAMLTQTLALVAAEQVWGDIYRIKAAYPILTFANFMLVPSCLYTIRGVKELLIKTDNDDILDLCNLILLLDFLGVIIFYDFQGPRTWILFWGRFFIIAPSMLFVYIVFILLKENVLAKKYGSKLVRLEHLRAAEKEYFDQIQASWMQERRLRHDLRHLGLLVVEYIESENYAKLKDLLGKFHKETAKINAEMEVPNDKAKRGDL